MRQVFALFVAIGLASLPAMAQDGVSTPAKPVAAKAPQPSDFTDADKTPEAIKKADAIMARTAKAYATAPAMTEVIDIIAISPMGQQKNTLKSSWGAGDTYDIDMDGGQMRLTSNGTSLYMTSSGNQKTYMEFQVAAADPLRAMMDATNGGGLPDPASSFRLDKNNVKPASMADRLAMGAIPNPKITGFRMAGDVPQLLIEGDKASNVVSFDPKTGLISRCDIKLTPPGAPAGFSVDVQFIIASKIMDKLPTAIAFDASSRERVDSPDKLQPQPIVVGEMAPEFTLSTLGGDEVTLASLKGQIVVLDFWATWCGPCKRGLPELQKVAEWAAAEKMPVKIFAVNVWERGTVDVKTKGVETYWNAQKFSFPTLMDLDDNLVGQYGLNSIPATYIIGRDGRIIGFHGGFVPGMADMLKKELTEAVEQKG